ncbi:DUF2721 domain-containing protein [Salidesulfovibrio brasiliensis]|uniref:DUF2721 domain-containing protein n=1 Tax=Salidesulfovibrio brasiliensis TaxID=221711 RepID=UPI000AD24105|nr:DUF2721 domain-containing protein [Salidesulfovibrio brasiliensis]
MLISGIGLLVLSMTNRIARPTDLIRKLLVELDEADEKDRDFIISQIAVLRRRCKNLRRAIGLSLLAIALIGAVTLLLFAEQIFGFGLSYVVALLFTMSLISLILSLFWLLEDIRITLRSLDIEIARHETR